MFVNALIPILVFAPAIGALLQTVNPRPAFCRTLAIFTSLVSAVAAVLLFLQMDVGGETPKFVVTWMKSYSIHFALGVDGLNLLPMLATALIFPVLLISEWDRQFGRRGIHALLLLLECSVLGALCAGDLFLLLFFLTIAPIPLYFLASIWGDEEREISAFRMISVSLVAGASFFFGVLLIYHSVEPHTFLIDELVGKLPGKTTEVFGILFEVQNLAFGLIVFALALKAPFWPLQGWFRKFILKVPTSIAVAAILAGYPIVLTVFTRIGFTFFPDTMRSHLDLWIGFGIANLMFGALSLLQEKDLRGILVSLSTVFVGFSLLGIGTGHSTGLVGSQFIIFSSLLALAVWGFTTEILRHRTRTYLISETRGVLRTLPDLGTATLISLACAAGIPGTVGFVSFALLYMGCFNYHSGIVVSALFISLIVTGFLIQIYRLVFLGERNADRYTKLSFRERLLLFPLVGVILFCGFFPSPFVEIVRATINRVLM
jgi:NADH-quinone oxidoreductase subunit M